MEPPLTDILYSRHLIIQDKMLRSGLNLHYAQYLITLRNADTSLFCKADRFCGPGSTWTVQNSLDNADTGRPLAQDCPAPLLLHQLDIILTLVRTVLASGYPFLPLYSKGKLCNGAFVAFNRLCSASPSSPPVQWTSIGHPTVPSKNQL